jgi:hypothetical protein
LKPFDPTIAPATLDSDAMMRIWKFTATNPKDPIWKGNWSPEPIIVRCESEAQARRLAEAATSKAFLPIAWQVSPINPWRGYKKIGDPAPPTLCEDITEHTDEYSVDGRAEVLRHGEKF